MSVSPKRTLQVCPHDPCTSRKWSCRVGRVVQGWKPWEWDCGELKTLGSREFHEIQPSWIARFDLQRFFGAVNYRWFRSFFALNGLYDSCRSEILDPTRRLWVVEFGTSCWEGTPSYLMDTPHPFCWSRHAFLASTTWNATSSCKLTAAWRIDRTVQHQRSVDAKKVAKAWCPAVCATGI